jgi:hypothetical protein
VCLLAAPAEVINYAQRSLSVIGSKEAHDLTESSVQKKERRLKEGEQAYAEYLVEQRRIQEKTVRLRALRLAREAAMQAAMEEPVRMKEPVRKGRAR